MCSRCHIINISFDPDTLEGRVRYMYMYTHNCVYENWRHDSEISTDLESKTAVYGK